MAGILIVDPSPFCRELVGSFLEQQGFCVATRAEGLQAAATTLSQVEPELIILEPGDGGGFAFLRALRVDARFRELPVIVLADAGTRELILRAGALGVRDYMLKSRFTRLELLTRVRKYLRPPAASPPRAQQQQQQQQKPPQAGPSMGVPRRAGNQATPTPTPAPLTVASPERAREAVRDAARAAGVTIRTREEMLQRLENAPLRTLPGAVMELIALVNSPRGSVADVAHVLRHDPLLSTRVLRVANSAAFTSHRARIASVEDAVKHIGMGGVQNLLATVGVFEAFDVGAADVTRLRCWQHSLAVAALMEKLSPNGDESAPPGSGYVVGLCHDLADLLLRQHFPDDHARALALARQTGQHPRLAQGVVFGMPYEQLAITLLSRLGLPPVITAPIQELYERGSLKPSARAGSVLARCLRMADVYANGLMLASGDDEPVVPLSKSECKASLGNEPWPAIDDLAIRADAVATSSAMANLSAADSSKAYEPLVPKRPLRICYVRHADYADLDPLHSLLQLTTETVDLRAELPAADDLALADADAVIVAGPRAPSPSAHEATLARLRQILSVRPLPALYLGGTAGEPLAAGVPLAAAPLPISIGGIAAFLAQCEAKQPMAA